MKKSFLFSLFIIVFSAALPFSFAQTSTVSGTSSTPVTFDYRYNAVLEFFLQKTLEKDYAIAYEQMHGSFQKVYTVEEFTNIVQQTGLERFLIKKWTSADDKMKDTGIATIIGEFTFPDQAVHEITFPIILQGSDLKIGNIVETIAISELTKRFPEKAKLETLILTDLGKITFFIARNKVKNMHAYLSPAARTRTKLKDIRKAFRGFRKLKNQIVLPPNPKLAMAAPPQLNEQGLMILQGNYKNEKRIVNFTLGYDYEWKWRLGFFTIEAQPLYK